MKRIHEHRSATVLRLSLCLNIAASSAALAGEGAVERRLAAMGTVLSMRVEAAGRSRALDASEAAAREIARVEDLLSTWKRGGALDRLNHAPAQEPVELSGEAARLLREVRAWTSRTRGAFDPTVLPLVLAWDLRGGGRIPAAAELSHALSATGWSGFVLSSQSAGQAARAARTKRDAAIDEGAWAKGYALDRARDELAREGVHRATLDLGGQVMILGAGRVEIADPSDRRRIAGWVDVADGSVSTSGNSERARVVGGRRIGHILDPRSGLPAQDFGSATVVAPTGLVADILSTAYFVLGPDEGLALAGELNRAGFPNEALFLLSGRGALKAVATPGLHFHRVEER